MSTIFVTEVRPMKKWILLVPAAAAAAGAAVLLKGKKSDAAPKAAKSAGKKKGYVMAKPQTGVYSFASGFKDAKTVEVRLSYDSETCSYAVASEEFIAPTGDSHAGILYAPDFAMQVEYAAYYAGEDFAALTKDTSERFKGFSEVSFGGTNGISYFNGKNYCMAFPAADATADYVLITVVNMGDDTEEEAAKLPTNEMLTAIMDTLEISAE